ncbi:MAG TPA: hypothetical protein EYP34_11370 [Chromatiaceae bacterium]|nr:hypothetical protein [Chromatiaceae bacterium]
MQATNQEVLSKISELYREVFKHDGYGDLKIEMRILRRGQKEVIVYCGKQYRYVVDFKSEMESSQSRHDENSLLTNVRA